MSWFTRPGASPPRAVASNVCFAARAVVRQFVRYASLVCVWWPSRVRVRWRWGAGQFTCSKPLSASGGVTMRRAAACARAQRNCHRVSYAITVLLFFSLLLKLRHSLLYSDETGYRGGMLAGLSLAGLLAATTYYLLQGSDPGYITAGVCVCARARVCVCVIYRLCARARARVRAPPAVPFVRAGGDAPFG